jgi:hypothetical protein
MSVKVFNEVTSEVNQPQPYSNFMDHAAASVLGRKRTGQRDLADYRRFVARSGV